MTERTQPMTEQTAPDGEYVIRKGGFFYRPNAEGYCSDILEAGRWSLKEAYAHKDGVEGVTVHLFKSFWPPKNVALAQENASLKARIQVLEEALQFIADGYENTDVNHVDYRVKTYQVATAALAGEGK
jgi:hypothetical protein